MLSVLFSLDGPSDAAVQTECSRLNISPGGGGRGGGGGGGEGWRERSCHSQTLNHP